MRKIEFGNTANTEGNRTTGVMSGVNTQSMVDAAVEKKKDPILAQEKVVTFNTAKITALTQFKNLLSSFQTSLASLKGLKFSEDGTDFFASKLVNLSTTSSENPKNYINISTDSNASLGNFNVQINQIALNKVIQSTGFTSNKTSVTNNVNDHSNTSLFTPGTFQLNAANITINQNDTLMMIASKINSSTPISNVSAQIISPQSGIYSLILQSTIPGLENDIVITDPNMVVNNIYSSSNSLLQNAQNSIFTYNNSITVNRPTNTVSDFISGVTFNLIKPTFTTTSVPVTNSSTDPNTNQTTTTTSYQQVQQPFTVNVNVTGDITSAVAGIKNFVDSYNTLVKFITQQQGKDADGHYYETANIQRDDYITNLMSNIITFSSQLAAINGVSNDIGITFADNAYIDIVPNEPIYNNLLTLDENLLTQSLYNNFEAVHQLFAFEIASDSTNILVQATGNNISKLTATLNIDITKTPMDIASANCNGTIISLNFTPSNPHNLSEGGIISGLPNTMFAGYEFYYLGSGQESIQLSISQGIADKIYNVVKNSLNTNPTTGTSILQQEIKSLMQDNRDKKQYIKEQLQSVDRYKEKLIKDYIKMEAELTKANVMTSLIEAQLKMMGN